MIKKLSLHIFTVSLILISCVLTISTSLEIKTADNQYNITHIYIIVTLCFFSIFSIYFLIKQLLNPYISTYSKVKSSLKAFKQGEYKEIDLKNAPEEIKDLISDYNEVAKYLNNTTIEIDTKLQVFLGYSQRPSVHKLSDSKAIINDLSSLYQFKREVELDSKLEDIYNRLSNLLEKKFNLDNFSIFEYNSKNDKIRNFNTTNIPRCMENIKKCPQDCRALSTGLDVISNEYHNTCPIAKEENYYCLTKKIDNKNSLVLHFSSAEKNLINVIKKDIEYIKSYLRESRPSIEVKHLMEELRDSAFKDSLTNTYNRKYLDETIKKILPQIDRKKSKIGVLMIDIDHFKSVNDEYGHDIGDKVLMSVAKIIQDTIRTSDMVIRYGGEEFLVLLIDIENEVSVLNVAEKIRKKVAEHEIEVYAGTKIQKTISTGVSLYPKDSNSFETVKKYADISLYESKENGRNQVKKYIEKKDDENLELF